MWNCGFFQRSLTDPLTHAALLWAHYSEVREFGPDVSSLCIPLPGQDTGYPKHDAGKTRLVKWNVTKVHSRVLTHGSQTLVSIKL